MAQRPLDPKAKERYASFVGLGLTGSLGAAVTDRHRDL
jgi:hypothetical protein